MEVLGLRPGLSFLVSFSLFNGRYFYILLPMYIQSIEEEKETIKVSGKARIQRGTRNIQSCHIQVRSPADRRQKTMHTERNAAELGMMQGGNKMHSRNAGIETLANILLNIVLGLEDVADLSIKLGIQKIVLRIGFAEGMG